MTNANSHQHPLRITSPRNQRLRGAFALYRKRERRRHGTTLLEGVRLILDALESSLAVETLFLDRGLDTKSREKLLDAARRRNLPENGCWEVEAGLLTSLSELETPPGAAAVAQVPNASLRDLLGHSPLVVGHGIQEPGNIGAILRVAAGLGAGGVVVTGGCDPFSPKAIRGSSGAVFRIPIVVWRKGLGPLCQRLLDESYDLLAADPAGELSHREMGPATGPIALLLGSEAHGFQQALPTGEKLTKVRIALAGGVESLNVAVAAGILLDRLAGSGSL